jgi:hypothetical protein
MLPTNGRPLGPGGSGNGWFAFPRSFDLARSKTSEAAKMPHKKMNAAMVVNVHRRMDSDSKEYTEREEGALLYISKSFASGE